MILKVLEDSNDGSSIHTEEIPIQFKFQVTAIYKNHANLLARLYSYFIHPVLILVIIVV